MNAASRSNQLNRKATPSTRTLPDLFTFDVLRVTQHAIRKTQYVTLAVAFLAVTVRANNTDNPYQGIVDRNVFGLRPPPPPPSNEPPKPPIPAINLTGITTILGKKMAFMTIQLPAKPGEAPKPGANGPTSFMLTEGERDGEIEVVSIDEVAGTVKVNDFGTVTNVTFGKLPSTPSPGGPGGIPSPNPVGVAGAGGQRSIPGLPARPLRMGNNQAGMNNGVSPGLGNGQANPGVGLGQGNQGVGLGQQNSYQQQSAPTQADLEAATRSPEENVLLYEANRIKNQDLINAGVKLPRMPQHPMLGGQGQQQPQ